MVSLPNFKDYIRSQDAKNTISSHRAALSAASRFLLILVKLISSANSAQCIRWIAHRFLMEVKKRDKKFYQPDCLSTMHRAIKRYLDNQNYESDILKDKMFETSRMVLAARRKELRKLGYGGKPNAARELTETEETMLFEQGHFSMETAEGLQRGVWWFLSINCGFRGNDESKKLCWGDISLEHDDENNRDYLIWLKEHGMKTRDGRESKTPQKIHGTVY